MARGKTDPQRSFQSIPQSELPEGRKGKHHEVVGRLINELLQLKDGRALKIPISELPDTKANIRSALSRAAKQKRLNVVTSSDDHYFYVWNGNKE